MPADTAVRRLVGTVRFRITALATLAVLAVLIATGTGLVVIQRRVLADNLESALDRRADDLAALVAGEAPPGGLALVGDDEEIAQVVTTEGVVLAASPHIAGRRAIAGPPPAGENDALRTVENLDEDGNDFLVVSRRTRSRDRPVVIHVGGTLDEIDQSIETLTASLSVAIPAVAAFLAFLVWWLVGRTLRPVEAIRAEVADIGGTELDRRVPQPAGEDEIARLARTMNAMLDRVEASARRQQRFVADASHELRSPLTRIRSELEVDLAHPATADLAATHRSVLEETAALQRLLEDLLQLARSDARVSRRERLDLDDIVLRDAHRLRAEGRVAVDASGVSAAQIHGDPEQLARAVRNLTDNAARHATGIVSLSLVEQDGAAVLSVADDGPGIPIDQHERVFERFTRLDEARTPGAGGAGLGLAITREIVERHGGTITIDADHRPGTRFLIVLPKSS
jgi:signal transduction histidine kinase